MKKQVQANYDVAVIGGGASGLMAAITAAREGGCVVIIDHNDRLGKKILSTGNGKCNYTNEKMGSSYYYGATPDFVASILEQFSSSDTVAFFQELGVYPLVQRGGYYPASEQASAVLDVLRLEVKRLGIATCLGDEITDISHEENNYIIYLPGHEIASRALILATGGAACDKSGSDGSGYSLATDLGHKIIPPAAALVALEASNPCCKALAGVRAKGKVVLSIDDEPIASDQGEIQFTPQGISGIPVFQISRFASYGLMQHKKVTAEINLFPQLTGYELQELLYDRFYTHGWSKTCEEACIGLLHKKLIPVLLHEAGLDCHMPACEAGEKHLKKLAKEIAHFTFSIVQTKGLSSAQVTAGGIDTQEVDATTLESTLHPGLFFAGELLDVDGICGGYNLQWAWSSGFVAGKTSVKDKI